MNTLRTKIQGALASEISWIISLLLLGAGLRLFFLDGRSLGFDEAKTLFIARAPLTQTAGLVRNFEGISPLYFWLMHFWIKPWANAIFGLRIFSFLASMAALGAFLILCRKALPRLWLLAFSLGCISSFWIHFGQQGRVYSVFLLVAIAQTWAALNLLRHPEKHLALVHYGLIGVIGIYLHPYYPIFLASNFISIALNNRNGAFLKKWALLHLGLAFAYAPWLPSFLSQVRAPDTSVLSAPESTRQILSILGTMIWDAHFLEFAVSFSFIAGCVALGVIGLGLFLLATQAKEGNAERPQVAKFFAFTLAMPFLLARAAELLLGRALTQSRYFVFSSPALYIFFAWTVESLKTTVRAKILRLALIVFFLFGAFLYAASTFFIDPRLSQLAEQIRKFSDKRAVLIHLQPYYYLSLRYDYLPEFPNYEACPDPKVFTWSKLPGYPPGITPAQTSTLKTCVAIDPERKLSPWHFSLWDCRALAKKICH